MMRGSLNVVARKQEMKRINEGNRVSTGNSIIFSNLLTHIFLMYRKYYNSSRMLNHPLAHRLHGESIVTKWLRSVRILVKVLNTISIGILEFLIWVRKPIYWATWERISCQILIRQVLRVKKIVRMNMIPNKVQDWPNSTRLTNSMIPLYMRAGNKTKPPTPHNDNNDIRVIWIQPFNTAILIT